MRKRSLFLLAAGLIPIQCRAAFLPSSQGADAADFLELPVDARGTALGEAYTSVVDNASALYWNPAALTRIERRCATVMHAAGLGSSFFDYAAYAQSLGRYGSLGASFQYLSEGTLTQTDDATGADIGTFRPSDLAVALGYAYRLPELGILSFLEGWSLGATAKIIQVKIAASDTTAAADLGLLSRAYLGRRLRFAASLSNLGGGLKFDQEAARIPVVLRTGASFKLAERWLASLDIGFPSDNQEYAALGGEYSMALGKAWSLAGRLGFNSRTLPGAAGFSGLSVGAGFAFEKIGIDYAFLPFGAVGNTHRVSLSARF